MPRRTEIEVSEALLRLGAVDPTDLHVRTVVSEHITYVLDACDGNRTFAAELLGIPRRTLQRWLAPGARPGRRRRRRARSG